MNSTDHTPGQVAQQTMASVIKRVRSKMLVVCDEIAPLMAREMTPAEAERIIEAAFVEALDELADEADAAMCDDGPANDPHPAA